MQGKNRVQHINMRACLPTLVKTARAFECRRKSGMRFAAASEKALLSTSGCYCACPVVVEVELLSGKINWGSMSKKWNLGHTP